MTRPILALLLSSLLAVPAAAQQGPLKQAEAEAQERIQAHKELERLRQDLRYIAEELDRERLENKDLAAYSRSGLARIAHLRGQGNIHPKLAPVLDRLEAIYAALPQKTWAQPYARSLLRAIATTLREAAAEAGTSEELLSRVLEQLVVPDQIPGEEDAFTDLSLFPRDVPLAQFKKLGPIRIFLVKHRIKRPASHAATTWQDIALGRHNVQAGVEIEGVVRRHYRWNVDGDYSFDIGDLHIEITPEWRLLHPNTPLPKQGQRVRVRGWSYFDVFHKAEPEYDPGDKDMGALRVTQWEIHPAQTITILP